MDKELSTLDQYLTDPDWGKSSIRKITRQEIRKNLLTNEKLTCDQDDLGNFVGIWDHVYLIHLSKISGKPEYVYVVNDYQWNNETKKKEIVGKIEKRVESATMFDINKTIMRCLVKNLAMFGLGLYIFAGEDMPEDVSMLEPASQRSKKLFLDALQLVANKYDKSIDEAVVALTDAASITADDSKWTKRDLGVLKRGVNWLEGQYKEETKEK
ncbi:hypothetical protein K5E_25310 [Enterococcus thailandicus]|nr:hypothetical protein K5E_25310 [Enterococcus thailandicus]